MGRLGSTGLIWSGSPTPSWIVESFNYPCWRVGGWSCCGCVPRGDPRSCPASEGAMCWSAPSSGAPARPTPTCSRHTPPGGSATGCRTRPSRLVRPGTQQAAGASQYTLVRLILCLNFTSLQSCHLPVRSNVYTLPGWTKAWIADTVIGNDARVIIEYTPWPRDDAGSIVR